MGDVKNVSDGYARNFLFPKKMAKLATDAALKEIDLLKKKLETARTLEREGAAKWAEQLKDVILEFTRKATKTGKIYSAITKEDIAETLTKQFRSLREATKDTAEFKVAPESVSLDEHEGNHIKQLGEHLVKVKLASDVTVEVKIKVSQEIK